MRCSNAHNRYWTLRTSASVRLRVMPVDSDAGYSALFVDVA